MQRGQVIAYESQAFPSFETYNNVHEHMHIVVPASFLAPGFRTMKDFVKDSSKALALRQLILFYADALHNALRYRGTHHGNNYVNGQPRAVCLITYATKRLFSNENLKILLPQEALFEESNIAAVVVSFLVLDSEIKFTDVLGDQLSINMYGLPRIKKRSKDEPPEDQNIELENAQRLDIEGKPLNFERCGYVYLVDAPKKHISPHHGKINSAKNLFVNLAATAGVTEQLPLSITRNTQHPNWGPDFVYHPCNFFSLLKCTDQLAQLGAHPEFCTPQRWLGSVNDIVSLGPPRWKAQQALNAEHEYIRVPENFASTTADLDLKFVTANAFIKYCLPHCSILDTTRLNPAEGLNVGDTMRIHQTDANGVMEERVIPVREIMNGHGFFTDYEMFEQHNASKENNDPFNAFHRLYAPMKDSIEALLSDPQQPSEKYICQMENLRARGMGMMWQVLSQANHILPESYEQLQYQITKRAWKITTQHLWQKIGPNTLSSYAQMKTQQLLELVQLVGIADAMLLYFPLLLRAVASTYFPRSKHSTNKLHVQIVCGPGASKSETLNRLEDTFLIPGTSEALGSATAMGQAGDMRPTRKIQLYHELPLALAPTSDPKEGEDRLARMLLTMLGNGFKVYTTSAKRVGSDGKVDFETGRTEKFHSEFTDTIIGCRNYRSFTGKPGGAADALTDRYVTVNIPIPLSQTKLAVKILTKADALLAAAGDRFGRQSQVKHRCLMEYGVGMAYYALPMPGLDLQHETIKEVINYLAVRRPTIMNRIRRTSQLDVETNAEVLLDAIEKGVFGPLNPTLHVGVTPLSNRPHATVANYDTTTLLPIIARYNYLRMDTYAHILSGTIWELIGGNYPIVLQLICERDANYFSIGRSPFEKKTVDYHYDYWQPASANDQTLAVNVPYVTLESFLSSLHTNAKYQLLVPVGKRQEEFKRRSNYNPGGADEAAYEEFPMIQEEIKASDRNSFNCGNKRARAPIKLVRPVQPAYRVETRHGKAWTNPNYITLNRNLSALAKYLSETNFGHYLLSEDDLKDTLKKLSKSYLVTPYLPLIENTSKHPLNLVQSLRYSPELMARFPHFRVPILIDDYRRNQVHILISYVEMNPYQTIVDVMDHISYHSTRPVNTVMAVFNPEFLNYEPLSIRPVEGKTLNLTGSNPVQPEELERLEDWLVGEETDEELDPRRIMELLMQKASGTQKYYEEDLELKCAQMYLKRNFPGDTEAQRKDYYPANIEQRFADFYREQFPSRKLSEKPYMARPTVRVAPPIEETTSIQLDASMPSNDSFNRLLSTGIINADVETNPFELPVTPRFPMSSLKRREIQMPSEKTIF